nr:metal ABC transporter permease [Allostreptomyces psammosilenae]
MTEMLDLDFMRRALLAAVIVGVAAPTVGIYLVQRRQAILGDGIGHVALTGVAVGFLTGANPVWTAVVVSALGAVLMELIRERGKASGDVALALLFYGGLSGGVMLTHLSPGGSTSNLNAYLFGSITTVSQQDIVAIVALAAFVLVVGLGWRRQLFALCQDEEFARVSGLPVRLLNLLLAVTAAVTVTVAMRVVGLLLVSALMVVPVATAQTVSRTFRATLGLAIALGVTVSFSGVVVSYQADVPPGASIVLLAIGVFLLITAVAGPLAALRARRAVARGAGAHPPAGAATAPGGAAGASGGTTGAPAEEAARTPAGEAAGGAPGTPRRSGAPVGHTTPARRRP